MAAFALPLIPALGYGSLLTGGATLGTAAAMPDLFFGDVKENAKREYANYDPSDGSRKRDFGDILGELFTGRKDATDKAVQDLHVNKLDDLYGVDISRIRKALQYDNVDFSNLNINENTKANKLKQTIALLNDQVANRKSLMEVANAAGYGDLAAALPTNQITSMIRGEKKKEAQAKEEKLRQREVDLLTMKERMASAERTHQATLQSDRLASAEKMAIRKDLSADKLRAQTERLAILQAENQRAANKDKFTLGQMQASMDNRRLDMKEEQLNRDNTMKMVATLMGGLKGLNASTQSFMPPRSYYTL